jgi:hypothetical protein
MAWITPTIAAVGAIANLASSGMNANRSNQQQVQDQSLQLRALQDAENNQRNQALVQALINQRSVAGTQDQYGGGTRYDPATNTWVTTQGKEPEAATRAAMQAAISRNTTDLRQAQFANEQEAVRAARAAPTADTAGRELANFRPMGSDQLVGLLGQQATLANNAVFNPLVADTLRSFARTGTSAGPVLGQIGRDAATNLRQSLIDAQIKGMTSVDAINQGRRSGLESSAANAATIARPGFQYSGISPAGVDNSMAQVVSQRASQAGVAPYLGMAGANQATALGGAAAAQAGKSIPDPNFALDNTRSMLSNLSGTLKPGGGVNDFLKSLNLGGTSTNAGDFSQGSTTNQGYTLAKGFQLGDAQQDPNSYWT